MSLLKIKLHWQILIALVIAVIIGYYFPGAVEYLDWMGKMFLRGLKMVIIPLIFASIVSGVTSIGSGKSLGRIGLKTITYYISTSLLAILTGLILVNIIKPGVGIEMGFQESVTSLSTESGKINDILIRMIPENLIDSMAKGDILPIIFFAILFGFFITQVADSYKQPLTNFFEGLFEVMMRLTMFIIRFTPLGILGIVSGEVARNSDKLANLAGSMAIYMLTVIIGLTIHAVITLPLILRLVARVKPIKHIRNMATPLLTAFSTVSSSATLPLTMEAVEHKSGVSNKISSFTLPLGATINMDGTALYECVAAMFIAQAYGIDLSFTEQMIVVFTALLASIGAAGIPMAGLVMITVVLTAVDLPLEGVGLIIAVDLILDMMRTTVNVWSDSCGAVTIARSEGEETNVA
ncbi:Na?dicarboxylate symporter [Bacteroidales bacterium 6E]|nr:Na?dicarboxylate symporter [Bacteroidales bacterium 6E]